MKRGIEIVVFIATLLLTANTAIAQPTHRPVQDFLDTQTSTSFWTDPAFTPIRIAVVDYAGLQNAYLEMNGYGLGTKFTGDITERRLDDGRTYVHIVLQGANVFMRGLVAATPSTPSVPLLGYIPPDVVAGLGQAGVGDMLFVLDFKTEAPPGSPLPDFFLIGSEGTGTEMVSYMMNARGTGPLRSGFGVAEGTPGAIEVNQRGLFTTGKGIPGQDYAPVEHVIIKEIGK